MNNYTEFIFKVNPIEPWGEILIAELCELGFDSFTEVDDGVLAYITKELMNVEKVDKHWLLHHDDVQISYEYKEMPNINWNEEWEKNFDPIYVENKVEIRAEFHESKNLEYELVIQPKMSFGTGHHATTYNMVHAMLEMDFEGKSVLDMGCGTSVLAILAKKKGAKQVLAIDNDPWSVENSIENAERNKTEMQVLLGDANTLGNENFDIILANINKNILLKDLPIYSSVLNAGGELLLSGIYNFDVDDVLELCTQENLKPIRQLERNDWVSLLLKKN